MAKQKFSFPSAVPKSERMAQGRALRKKCSRASHAAWEPHKDRPDPIAMMKESEKGRIKRLLPIRYARMSQSPFSFYRGSAGLMAADLAHTPVSGIEVQLCGDSHLMNFGGFATPERKLVFDITDFDETLPGPWEWDVKRLAASCAIAARWRNFKESACREAAWQSVNSYRLHMQEYAKLSALKVWYAHLDLLKLVETGNDEEMKKFRKKRFRKAMEESAHEKEFAKHTFTADHRAMIKDHPPLIFHPHEKDEIAFINKGQKAFEHYLTTLPEDRRILLKRYVLQDIAVKVVGVGSVGTFCGIALMISASADPLFLQFKEANPSVLEPYLRKSKYANHGERIVQGQKLIQSAYDIFLGWMEGERGHHFYVRQLRDAKVKPILEMMNASHLHEYSRACGWALARAHARTGDAAMLTGYMGKSETFDDAIATFSMRYADQNEQDYELMIKAIRAGKFPVAEIV